MGPLKKKIKNLEIFPAPENQASSFRQTDSNTGSGGPSEHRRQEVSLGVTDTSAPLWLLVPGDPEKNFNTCHEKYPTGTICF